MKRFFFLLIPLFVAVISVFLFMITSYPFLIALRTAVAFMLFASMGYIWSHALLRHQNIPMLDATILGAGISTTAGTVIVWLLYQLGMPLKGVPIALTYVILSGIGLLYIYIQDRNQPIKK